jgi:hypothetical protein
MSLALRLRLWASRALYGCIHVMLALLACIIAVLLLPVLAVRRVVRRCCGRRPKPANDWRHAHGDRKQRTRYEPDMRHGVQLLQRYLTMRDGTKIGECVRVPAHV